MQLLAFDLAQKLMTGLIFYDGYLVKMRFRSLSLDKAVTDNEVNGSSPGALLQNNSIYAIQF